MAPVASVAGLFSRRGIALTHLIPELTHVGAFGANESVVGGCYLAFADGGHQSEPNGARLHPLGGSDFVLAGRVHNRAELARALGLAHPETDDAELVRKAYQRWGSDAPSHIIGNWAFAAWNAEKCELFLARDHGGHGDLYYYIDDDIFAFASSKQTLLSWGLGYGALDELDLAQVLICWTAYIGEQSGHRAIKRLCCAHSLTVTPSRCSVSRYWYLDRVRTVELHDRRDYVSGLLDVLNLAIGQSLAVGGKAGSMLSGGLDSGTVTTLAAEQLRARGLWLDAFTSVPIFPCDHYVNARVADEYPLACATAEKAGNVRHHAVDARQTNPVRAIRETLPVLLRPLHTAGNFYWLQGAVRMAIAENCDLLLTGTRGNGGISWTGSPFSQPLWTWLPQLASRDMAKRALKRFLPRPVVAKIRQMRTVDPWPLSPINRDFARRIRLFERQMSDPEECDYLSPRDTCLALMQFGRGASGAFMMAMTDGKPLYIHDPTADPRVLEFCLSVPDRVFIDRSTGTDRWLIRETMKGRLPESVRTNKLRGFQSADIVPRLRACAEDVEDALAEISEGEAPHYIDMARMRDAWAIVQKDDTWRSLRLAGDVIVRGIMAGLFVNGFGKTW